MCFQCLDKLQSWKSQAGTHFQIFDMELISKTHLPTICVTPGYTTFLHHSTVYFTFSFFSRLVCLVRLALSTWLYVCLLRDSLLFANHYKQDSFAPSSGILYNHLLISKLHHAWLFQSTYGCVIDHFAVSAVQSSKILGDRTLLTGGMCNWHCFFFIQPHLFFDHRCGEDFS